ncbi:MAG: DUF4259 domain-containing protein [Chloroflexales bacterium]|nr:DUF4259 domain-containing protein [Chloroflexales bacterium]
MGTWGSGNFENDGAGDYRDSITYQLIDKVEACFEHEEGYALDEGGEAELMPSVAMLVVLCEHCDGIPPAEAVAQTWKRTYLQIYDDQIEDLAPNPAFRAERRKVIEATFDRLIAIAHSFWTR